MLDKPITAKKNPLLLIHTMRLRSTSQRAVKTAAREKATEVRLKKAAARAEAKKKEAARKAAAIKAAKEQRGNDLAEWRAARNTGCVVPMIRLGNGGRGWLPNQQR